MSAFGIDTAAQEADGLLNEPFIMRSREAGNDAPMFSFSNSGHFSIARKWQSGGVHERK